MAGTVAAQVFQMTQSALQSGGRPTELQEQSELVRKLDQLAQDTATDLSVESVLISVADHDSLLSIGAHPGFGLELDDRRHRMADTLCRLTVEREAPLWADNAPEDPALRNIKYVSGGHVVGYAGVPIELEGTGVIGAMCAITSSPRRWKKVELGYLRQASKSIGQILRSELRDLEERSLTEELSEADKILSSLASKSLLPMSIYKPDGELMFVSALLLQDVPFDIVSGFWARQPEARLIAADDTQGGSEVSRVSKEAGHRVDCARSSAGLIVCSWYRLADRAN